MSTEPVDQRAQVHRTILRQQIARGGQASVGIVVCAVGVAGALGIWWGVVAGGALLILTSGYWRNWG